MRLTHATPAANYARTAVRDWESDREIGDFEDANHLEPIEHPVKDIAAQLIDVSPVVLHSLKVALGGGRAYFEPNTEADPEYSTLGRSVMAGICPPNGSKRAAAPVGRPTNGRRSNSTPSTRTGLSISSACLSPRICNSRPNAAMNLAVNRR